MMYSPNQKPQAIKFADSEERRKHFERIENIKRLIHYNNKRVLVGLPPLVIPRPLWEPIHRDDIMLLCR